VGGYHSTEHYLVMDNPLPDDLAGRFSKELSELIALFWTRQWDGKLLHLPESFSDEALEYWTRHKWLNPSLKIIWGPKAVEHFVAVIQSNAFVPTEETRIVSLAALAHYFCQALCDKKGGNDGTTVSGVIVAFRLLFRGVQPLEAKKQIDSYFRDVGANASLRDFVETHKLVRQKRKIAKGLSPL